MKATATMIIISTAKGGSVQSNNLENKRVCVCSGTVCFTRMCTTRTLFLEDDYKQSTKKWTSMEVMET